MLTTKSWVLNSKETFTFNLSDFTLGIVEKVLQ